MRRCRRASPTSGSTSLRASSRPPKARRVPQGRDRQVVADHQGRQYQGRVGSNRRDALEDQRQVVLVLVSLDLIPRQAGLERGAFDGARSPGLDEAPDDVPLAAAVGRDVHGEAERLEAVVLRAPYEIIGPRVVAAHVELEHAQVVGRSRGLLEAGLAHGGEHLRHAELPEPRAADAAPPSTIDSRPPIGASITGNRTFVPRKVEVLSILLTSRSTRGRNASESSAMRLRRTVVSVSAPPTR
jgi:hypothetical protein